MAVLKEQSKRLTSEQTGSAVIPIAIPNQNDQILGDGWLRYNWLFLRQGISVDILRSKTAIVSSQAQPKRDILFWDGYTTHLGLPAFNFVGWFNGYSSSARLFKHVLWLISLHRRYLTLWLAGIGLTLVAAYSAGFMWPRNLNFAYGQTNCITSPTLFPSIIKSKSAGNYAVTQHPSISIAGYPLYSQSTCLEPQTAPQPQTTEKIYLSAFGNPVFKKSLAINSGEFPKIEAQISADSRVPAHRPITFTVHGGDKVFDYRLVGNNNLSACSKYDSAVSCELAPLALTQGQEYQVSLERLFKGSKVGEVLSQTITTIEPLSIIATSITANSKIFDSPATLSLDFNKPLATISGLKLEALSPSGRTEVPITLEQKLQQIIVTFNTPLARETSYELIIDSGQAADQSTLEQTYILPFSTSGGPKVAGVNIGGYKIQPGSKFTISFDSQLAVGQNFADFVSVETNGQAVSSNISHSGSTLTITPASLGKCTAFTIKVHEGLVNQYGVGGGQTWQHNSRTICQTTFSIGTSVNGRGITGYRFGNGASKIIFVGGTHGNEKSSVYTLNSLIDHLEANPSAIPSHRTVIIIPSLNPDGYAANRRTNANNVDLNRNFPSNSWKQSVTMPGGELLTNGGGHAPLSEPESSALASYVLSQNPRMVLTYHSTGGMVIANESGDSYDQTLSYGQKSGLWARKNSELGNTFAYDTTGAFEDWLHDKHSVPTLLIELRSHTSNSFASQKTAILHIINLP
jgi:murein peptide amidase A